jgi:hypothetical protein
VLDDPTFGENDEAMQLIALDDLQRPRAGVCDRGGDPPSPLAGIGEDALDEGEEAARALVEDKARAVAIVHIGRMDDDFQQEAERVNEDLPLAARDLLVASWPCGARGLRQWITSDSTDSTTFLDRL